MSPSLTHEPTDHEIIAPFFDSAFYVARYPERCSSEQHPIDHYLTSGWREHCNPSSEFDTDFYLDTYPDVAEEGINPLIHYVRFGRFEARKRSADDRPTLLVRPSDDQYGKPAAIGHQPYVDPATIDVGLHFNAIREMFDEHYYLETYPDVAKGDVDPFLHYLNVGYREGRNPSATFDSDDYRTHLHGDAHGDMNPLAHFVMLGRARGLVPIAARERAILAQEAGGASADSPELALIRAHFDPDFYYATYADVAATGYDPVLHYVGGGWREGRDPSPAFSTSAYLDAYADSIGPDTNPFEHYLQSGKAQGFTASASSAAAGIPGPDGFTDAERAQILEFFDAEHYLLTYPDVREAGIDPLGHYLHHGWREGRNPSADFDTDSYLLVYPDVRERDVCPIVDFALRGRYEGRTAIPPLRFERRIVRDAEPPSDRIRWWLRDIDGATASRAGMRRRIESLRERLTAGILISFSHDDYAENVGGVQNIVGDELKHFENVGFIYLHVSPAQPLPVLARPDQDGFLVSVRINGEKLGLIALDDVADLLGEQRTSFAQLHVVIHHLLGFAPEAVTKLIQRLAPTGTYKFIHDFFTYCINFTLLRDDVVYCGAPKVESGACTVCVYGGERREHMARIGAFLKANRPELVIYSPSTRDIWKRTSPYVPLEVIPSRLARIDDHDRKVKVPRNLGTAKRPLRIGFLGTPAHLKGWNVFSHLAKTMAGDPRYEFFKLSARPEPGVNVHHLPVSVKAGDRLAMVRTLVEEQIDVAMIWSLWPETFCFTAYEALAAGCYVVTYKESGNVWPAIESHGAQGIRMDDIEELIASFTSGDIIRQARTTPRHRGDLVIEAPLAKHLLVEDER